MTKSLDSRPLQRVITAIRSRILTVIGSAGGSRMMPDGTGDRSDRVSRRAAIVVLTTAGAATVIGALTHTSGHAELLPNPTPAVPLVDPTGPRGVATAPSTPIVGTTGMPWASDAETSASQGPAPLSTEPPTPGLLSSATATDGGSTPTVTVATTTPTASTRAVDAGPRFVDLLGMSAASYAGAVPGRATNIELAARRLDGATVLPGEIFSFLDALGPQTLEAGFRMGYGIVQVNGEPRTMPLLGGGICDVSTILFQAAFRCGLGIVELHHHSFWIEHYGRTTAGAVGLDATVDVQPVDFKFKNSTSYPLRIGCSYANQVVTVQLLGTRPNWTVTLGKPVLAKLVKADPAVVQQPDPTVPVGSQVIVETARDGFDVTWNRKVFADNLLVDHYQFTTHYLPSRNIVAVGSKGATVTATPTVTPSPTAVPKREVTPTATPTPEHLLKGQVRVPRFIGMFEVRARPLIVEAGLTPTMSNYQGPGDVPTDVLNQYPVGAVMSQSPAPDTVVPIGTRVSLAVRKR